MFGLSWRYLFRCLFFLFLHLQFICSLPSNWSAASAQLCSPDESFALLHFKNAFLINTSAPIHCSDDGSYPKTVSWKEGSDCCSWDGVTCDRSTGHVIGLDLSSSGLLGKIHVNSSLFLLHHLLKLNLACNDFMSSEILSNFSRFTKLIHLNLSSSNFSGVVPSEISHLSKLASLDLSYNTDHGLEIRQHGFDQLLQNLTAIRYLILDNVNLSSVVAGSLVNLSSSLISLSLGNTQLRHEFPNGIFHLPFLRQLCLSGNGGLTGNLPKSNWSSPLISLDLSYTNFSGILPDTIGNLIHINVLDLSYFKFIDSIPTSLWNLTGMTLLDLTFNNFTGQVPTLLSKLGQLTRISFAHNSFSGQFPDVFGNLSRVIEIYLFDNNFSGPMPSSAFNLTEASLLHFSHNHFAGHLPYQVSGLSRLSRLKLSNNFLYGRMPSWMFTLPSLQYLDLRKNKLTGSIPSFVFENLNLTFLDLSSNNFTGVVKSDMFSKLKNLEVVDISNNSLLSLRAHTNVNFVLPKLKVFGFSSCNITKFPSFLRNSTELKILDLSNNKIRGKFCKWKSALWQKLQYLDLSHNCLKYLDYISAKHLKFLDLHSNLLRGPLFVLPPSKKFFSISNNKMIGEIPSLFCNSSRIQYLNLSNYSMSRMIPQCHGKYNKVLVLDLSMNSALTTLNLHGNQLEGTLPQSLAKCTSLEVLDVSNNTINDTFPHWLATLPKLQVLMLRANRFHGPIGNSNTRHPFPKLRILDLSHNQFTGLLPTSYFKNFKSMMNEDNDSGEVEYMGSHGQYYSTILTVKGIDIEMERILTIFTIIDLSNNHFKGRIPKIVGKLNSLRFLNFSHNILTGPIPPSLGNLIELEALDLSSNNIIGEIPEELTKLTFLSVLNLWNNQLVGRIPQGKQFDTFQNDSYFENLGLCGLPLSAKCIINEVPNAIPIFTFNEEHDISSKSDWKFIMMGYACGLVLGFSMGYIVLTTGKPHWFIRMVEVEGPKKARRLNRRYGYIGRRN